MSEPNAGSDVVSMKLKAEKKGEAALDLGAEMGRGTDLWVDWRCLCWVSRSICQLDSFFLNKWWWTDWQRQAHTTCISSQLPLLQFSSVKLLSYV